MKAGQTLVVLYSDKLEEVKEFYELLGLKFQKEKHGKGPEHFACDLGEVVLEIYPAATDMSKCFNAGTLQPFKLGMILQVDRGLVVDSVCEGKIRAFREGNEPDLSKMVLTQDPEGRRVELWLV